MSKKLVFASLVAGVLTLFLAIHSASAQNISASSAPALINQNIDEGNLVELIGNTRAEASSANDRGAVADSFQMDHMLIQLRRSPQQEQALEQFINGLQTKGSPNFHQWLTAQQFGAQFGLAQQDLDTITRWLESHGFKVNLVYPNGMVIDVSGNAGQVREAFKTEIHHLSVNGEAHIGNMSNPRIPAALAPAVVGIVSLHDFKPQAMHKMRAARPNFTFSDGFGESYALVPADLATIYNLSPLFTSGYSGQGQTIVVIEDTDVFSKSDWNSFRSTLGLSSYTSASFTVAYPQPSSGPNNCSDPGVVAPNDAEAILDAEWASAAAPNAAIEMATCADTITTFGGLIALQNLINASNQPPAIMSISYGQCETQNGASANAAFNSAYQQAASEGVSVFVAAGDSGAAGCDNNVSEATNGIGVNAFASTPYNVAVGGTDFSDTLAGTNANYWNSTNSSSYGSALSYIPEIPWNDSCAGTLLSNYEGYPTPYGSNGLCNSSLGGYLQTTVAGGGGPSACASGAPAVSGDVGGTCQGWPKPSWQSVLGNPNDGVRDTPDVSLFAADGLWSHYYVFCWTDTANGGAACTGAPSGWSGAGGTSFASPIMAGIQALVNQKSGERQGNPNPSYYQLAANEYGSNGAGSCNSSNGAAASSTCIFYDVTQGDMDVNCTGTVNCYLPSGTTGVLSTSDSAYDVAYGATTGWDFATGIGSINAANLVNNWPTSGPNYNLSASPSSLAITQGSSATSSITITPQNGFTGNVTLTATGLPNGVTASFSPNPGTTASTLTLMVGSTATIGTVFITVTGTSGSLSSGTTITLTVNSFLNYTLSPSPSNVSVVQGSSGTSTISVIPQNGFSGSVTLSASGLPAGVTASFTPNPATAGSTLMLAASATATTGNSMVTVTGISGGLTNTATISLTVMAPPNYTISASPSSVSTPRGSSGTSTMTVSPQNGFSGSVTFSASGLPAGVTASFTPNPATATSTLTLTASSTATTGTVSVNITGTSGSLSNATTLTLTVTSPPLLGVWLDEDIGQIGVAGSASYANGQLTVNGSGQYIWGTADSFNFLYQPLSGDGSIVARVVSVQGGSSSESGVMIRAATTAGSEMAYVTYSGSTDIYSIYRTSTGGSAGYSNTGAVSLPHWVKVSRSGNTISSYTSADGVNWVQVGGNQTINLGANVYIGLAVSSNNNSAVATSVFDNVSVSTAAAPAPVITGVTPAAGVTGSQAVISGSGFGASQGSSIVTLNGVAAAVNAWTAGSITITIPSGASSGPLSVLVAPTMNSSNPVTFSVEVPNYTLTASPSNVSVVQGASGMSAITVTPQNGFSGSVTLSASGLPAGVTASFTPNPATATSTLTLAASATATTGNSTVTVTGTSGSLTNAATVSLTVTAAPNYTISASPSNVSIVQGTSGMSTITVTPLNGFSGSVAFSASGLPTGVTASFAPNPATAASTLTLTASGTATTGAVSVNITGTSGSLSNATTLTLTVTSTPLLGVWLDEDVGQVGVAGSASYANGVFTVKGSGQYIWGTADSFNFLYQPLSGDGSIVARVVSVQGGSSSESGVMIRQAPTAGSEMGYLAYSGSTDVYWIYRTSTGGGTSFSNTSAVSLPHWVKVSRSGNTVSSYASADGVNWVQVGTSQTINMGTNVYIGLAVSSNNNSALATTTFDNVSVTTGPAPSYTISASPSSVSTPQGSSGTSTVAVTPQNGFSGSVTLSASGLPTGVTASFTPNPATATSTLALTASGTATTGTVSVNITGTSGSLSNATTLTLTVTSPPLLGVWLDEDVGQVGVAGSASYANGVFTVKGSGQYIWGTADSFNFLYQPLSGDGSIVARVVSVQGGSSSESGVMIRQAPTAGSEMGYLAYSGSTDVYWIYRTSTGGGTSFSNTSAVSLPHWVKVSRSGNTVSSYASADGVNWVQVGTSQTINMGTNVYIGLAVSSNNNSALATTTFDNVSVSTTQ